MRQQCPAALGHLARLDAHGLCGKLALIGRHAVIATVDRKKEPIFKWPMPELLDPLAASKPFITRRVLV